MAATHGGLRTLVAIGAAGFVIFAGLVPGDSSPTRVAAQVVSGIGFLGAGIIFPEGLQPARVIAWSLWRRAHQAEARRAHLKRKTQL